jgi:hypothetical protein
LISVQLTLDAISASNDESSPPLAPGGDAYGIINGAQFTLDPSLAEAGYTIIYSDGFGNVPEPTGVAVLCAGLLGLGLTRLNRKRVTNSA